MPSFQIGLTVRDNVTNWLKRALPFFRQYGRNLAAELRYYALREASRLVFEVYDVYQPKVYDRTYQLMEGINAYGVYRGALNLDVGLYNTAVNRDPTMGQLFFPYPSVVELGQGQYARDIDDITSVVAKAMGKSQTGVFVRFFGKYGWHEMPPRPHMIPAIIATGNYLYYNRLGRVLDAWARRYDKPETRRIVLRR